MIEDHLGHYSDSDLDELQQKLNSLNNSPWPESLALPRVPSCVSSHRSPRSPVVKGRSSHNQKFRFDCPPAGSDPPSQHCHASRNTFQRGSNVEGSEDQGSNVPSARAAAPYLASRSQVKGRCDDMSADPVAGTYGCLPTDIDNDVREDLSQLMKKKLELEVESFLFYLLTLFQVIFSFSNSVLETKISYQLSPKPKVLGTKIGYQLSHKPKVLGIKISYQLSHKPKVLGTKISYQLSHKPKVHELCSLNITQLFHNVKCRFS